MCFNSATFFLHFTYVLLTLRWIHFKGSISIFSRTCIFTKYFQVFHYKVLYALHIILCIICTLYLCHEMAAAWKKEKKILQKGIDPIVLSIYQCMYIHSTRRIYNLHICINFFRSLLEDLEHQSRWREVDYLDDTAEGDPNFLTPYRLVSLKVS